MPEAVSVIIPAYNAAGFLAEALASVAAQNYHPLEIIVIDDGSADATAAVARAFSSSVQLIEQPHAGAGAARNTGVAAAHGEILAFLDADDLWIPGSLALRLDALQRHAAGLVYGQVIEFRTTPDGRALDRPPVAALLPGTALVRASAFHRVGPFRTDLRVGEFIDWSARASEAGLRVIAVPQPVLRRRLHETNTGIRERAARADYVRVARAALERRRRREEPRA
jgi:glycosyltransferase involved in cell wall biosynthesis